MLCFINFSSRPYKWGSASCTAMAWGGTLRPRRFCSTKPSTAGSSNVHRAQVIHMVSIIPYKNPINVTGMWPDMYFSVVKRIVMNVMHMSKIQNNVMRGPIRRRRLRRRRGGALPPRAIVPGRRRRGPKHPARDKAPAAYRGQRTVRVPSHGARAPAEVGPGRYCPPRHVCLRWHPIYAAFQGTPNGGRQFLSNRRSMCHILCHCVANLTVYLL